MKKLLLLLGLFLTFDTIAQQHPKLELINQAELAIVDGKLEKAAEIYNQLFLQKDEIWAQDLYNAAVVEMKLGSFETVKKYLNELAKRGVSLEALESVPVFEEMKTSFQWQSYASVYNQLQEYSSENNQYTDFISEMEAVLDSLQKLSNDISYIPIRTTTSDSTFIRFEGQTLYAISNNQLSDTLQDLLRTKIDSVQQLPERIKKLDRYNDGCYEALAKYKAFFAQNDWPLETDFNNVRVHSIGNPLNILSMNLLYLPDLGSSAENLIETKTSNQHFFKSVFKGEDSLVISSNIQRAVAKGRLKPFIGVQLLNYKDFLTFQNFKVFEIRVDQSENCEEINGKHFVKYFPLEDEVLKKYKYFETVFGIPKHEDFVKKVIFAYQPQEPYSFNVQNQVELSVFSTCESAREFAKDAQVFLQKQ